MLDLTNRTFGELTAICRVGKQKGFVIWRCQCTCGATVNVRMDKLRDGTKKFCSRTNHKVERKPTLRQSEALTYRSWQSMKQRCSPAGQGINHKNYYGRGITVCDRWRSFENFLKDMGPRPSSSHSIERKDNSKGYKPSNCIWATSTQQNRNKRNSLFLEVEGKRLLLVEVAKQYDITYPALVGRVKSGWPTERILSEPVAVTKPRGPRRKKIPLDAVA